MINRQLVTCLQGELWKMDDVLRVEDLLRDLGEHEPEQRAGRTQHCIKRSGRDKKNHISRIDPNNSHRSCVHHFGQIIMFNYCLIAK